MITVPLADVPAQSLNITLDGQAVTLNLYTLPRSAQWYSLGQPNTYQQPGQINTLFMDVLFGGNPVLTCIQCGNLQRLLEATQYTPFVGDFVFVDTQASADPVSPGLGTRYQLIYLEAADLG